MRSLITGGAGFIGSHLCDELLARGHDVIVLDDLSTGRLENVEHLRSNGRFELVLGNILDEGLVDQVIQRCDVVYHLAAAVGVQLIIEHPMDSLRTNIRGSEIVLEVASRHGRPVLVTSTSEIYGKNASARLHEDDDRILGSPLKSRWSYSEAKAIEEVLAYTYHVTKGLRTVIVRLFNTVGPRQSGRYGMVLPRFVSQALSGRPVTVFGDGTQTRTFCAVADVAPALPDLMHADGAEGRVFNIGGSEEISIADLAKRVISATNSTSELRCVPYDDAYEEGFEDMPRRVPDTTRAFDLIGFQATWSLTDIIASVIAEQRA